MNLNSIKRFILIAVAAAIVATGARAQDKQPREKITVAQALSILVALRNLDGHIVIVKQGGVDNTVMVPWDFGSGMLRLKIANNMTILSLSEKAANDARQSIVKEVLKTMPAGARTIEPNTAEMDEFTRQYNEVLAGPAPGTQDLSRIKASELRLDKNDIPVTALSALTPILDDDVSKSK